MRQKTADSELRQIGSNVAMVDILDEDEDDDYVGDDNDDTDDALHVCYYITCMVYHFGVH